MFRKKRDEPCWDKEKHAINFLTSKNLAMKESHISTMEKKLTTIIAYFSLSYKFPHIAISHMSAMRKTYNPYSVLFAEL